MNQQLKKQLQALRAPGSSLRPNEAWVADTRKQMLSRIAGTTAQNESHTRFSAVHEYVRMILPSRAFLVVRMAAVCLLVVGLAVSGWLTGVSAAYNSLPGDFLYGVKLASEKTQQVVAKVTGNSEASVQLSLKSASRRAEEIKQIAKEKPEEVQKTTQRLQKSLEDAKAEVNEVKAEDLPKAIELAKGITEQTEKITTDLKQVESETVAKNLAETVKQIDGVEFAAIEVVLEGNPTEATEFAKRKAQTLLESAAETLASAEEIKRQANVDVSTTTNTPVTEIILIDIPITTDTSTISSTVIAEIEVPTTTVSTTPVVVIPPNYDELVEQVSKGTEMIKTGVDEVDVLIAAGKLQLAVQKLKELSAIQQNANTAVGTALDQ